MNIRSSVASGCSRVGVDAGFLAGLAQRGVHRSRVAGIGRAAGERGLAGVVAQRRRAHGDQQVGVVGQRRRRRSSGPENSTSTAASRFGAGQRGLGVGARSPRPAHRRAPAAGTAGARDATLSTSGLSHAGAASGVSGRPFGSPALTPALLSVRSTAAAISSALANDRGRISATLPSGAQHDGCGHHVGHAQRGGDAAAARPAASAAARPARPAATMPRSRSRPDAR